MKTIATILISFISLTTVNASNTASASLNNNSVEIKFAASNNNRFEIERSFYNNNFTVIASVNVPFATNMMVNDNAAELAGKAVAYYRVKTTAANGTVSYSNTMVVSLNGTETASVKSNNTISFTAAQNGNAVITLKSLTGNTSSVKTTTIAKGANSVELNNLAKGIYTATISVNGVTVDTQKVIAE